MTCMEFQAMELQTKFEESLIASTFVLSGSWAAM